MAYIAGHTFHIKHNFQDQAVSQVNLYVAIHTTARALAQGQDVDSGRLCHATMSKLKVGLLDPCGEGLVKMKLEQYDKFNVFSSDLDDPDLS